MFRGSGQPWRRWRARIGAPDQSRRQLAGSVDVWERWTGFWNLLFYATLAVGAVSAVSDTAVAPGARALAFGLSLLWAAWHAAFAPKLQRRRTGVAPEVGYTAITMLLWLGLTVIHPAYFWTTFSVYWQLYSILPTRWAIPLSVAFTAIIGLRNYLVEPGTNAWSVLLYVGPSALFGTIFALWLSHIIDQSAERRELIEELESTRAQLATEERRAGTLGERQRLAGEIHDTLAQGFTSIVMHLEAAEQHLPPDAATARGHLDRARRTARESLGEARRFVWALQPQELASSPLGDALERVAARWSEETGVRADVTLAGEARRLRPDTEVTLLRAVQEALANVGKHANASSVAVTLSYMPDRVALDVRDDGVGFSRGAGQPPAREGGGYGLRAMGERARGLGGRLGIESETGEGTALVLELPTGDGKGAPAPMNGGGAHA